MAAAPAWLQCTGAVNVFARAFYTGTPVYLGTCIQHPTPEGDWGWEPVINDLGGSRKPFDKQFMGNDETIVLDLNRFNQANYELITSQPNFDGNVGGTNKLDRGSFLIQPNADGTRNSFELWLQYTFFNTVNASDPNLPPGTYYPCCNVAGDHIPQSGTKDKIARLIVEANNMFNPPLGIGLTLNSSNFGFFLKSYDLSYFGPLAGIIPT